MAEGNVTTDYADLGGDTATQYADFGGDTVGPDTRAQQEATSKYLAEGSADDENAYATSPTPKDEQSSEVDSPTSGSTPETSSTSTGTNSATDTSMSSSPTPQQTPSLGAAKTVAGKAGDTSKATSANTPINDTKARLWNPLGDFSSYTYQISLYMLSPEAYNSFVNQGYKTLNSVEGAYLIAQSGGINNSGPTPRGKYFDLDFYIDNLRIKTLTFAKQQTSLNTLEYEFDIIEPVGFSFSDRLVKTARYIRQTSKKQNNQTNDPNPMNQQYVIAIRFYGYDKNGAVINGGKYAGADNVRTDESSVFERFYPIYITDINFTLNGKPVTYHIKATLYDTQRGGSSKTGQVKGSQTMVASNVREALIGGNGAVSLQDILNNFQAQQVKQKAQSIPNKYYIKFDSTASEIEKAMFEQEDAKNTSVGTAVTKTDQNTVGASNANKTGAGTKKNIPIPPGMSVIQTIEHVIRQSTYPSKSMNKKISENDQPNAESNPKPDQFRWFVINPVAEVGEWDPDLKDWSHTITYYIKPYDAPYVKSLYVSNNKAYYGPHKRYNYWFTGLNSEIINYEQQYNNLYYVDAVTVPDGNMPAKLGKYSNTPSAPNAKSVEDSSSAKPNKSNEAVNATATSLYSPADTARAKITILGDPDFIEQSVGSQGQTSPPTTVTVGRDYTWNANGGQVFVEIDFNTATDYNNQGLLTPNDQVKFWKYPPELAKKVKGVIYQVIQVDSTFNRGKFTQNLDLVICSFPGNSDEATAKTDKVRADSATPNDTADKTPDARKETTPSDQNTGVQYADFGGDTNPRGADSVSPASDSTANQEAGTASEADQVTSDTRDTTVPTQSGNAVQDDEANKNSGGGRVVEPAGREPTTDNQSDGFARVRAANNGEDVVVPSTNTPAQQAGIDALSAASAGAVGRPGSPSWNLVNRNR